MRPQPLLQRLDQGQAQRTAGACLFCNAVAVQGRLLAGAGNGLGCGLRNQSAIGLRPGQAGLEAKQCLQPLRIGNQAPPPAGPR
jgi:hypothetical protein